MKDNPRRAKSQRQLALSQDTNSTRTLTPSNIRLIDESVKQYLLIARPETLRALKANHQALIRNTHGSALFGYALLQGYGKRFDDWSRSDGSVVAYCGATIGFKMRKRLKLCLACVVAELQEVSP